MPHLRRYIRTAEQGSTEPPIFEADDGHHYLVKGGHGLMPDHLAEYLAFLLAPAFTVPTPPVVRVRVPPSLVEATRFAGPACTSLVSLLESGGGELFGSRYLPDARLLDPVFDLAADERGAAVLRLLAFDLWIGNRDRRTINPNALYVRHHIVAIDHAQAFPWLVGDRADLEEIARDHIARAVLDRTDELSLARVGAHVMSVDPAFVEAALLEAPAQWWPRGVHRDELFGILLDQRDAVARFFLRAAAR